MAFSLSEKLAVTGAFLAVVALVVGTEDDPGVVVTGQETVKELRPVAPQPPQPVPESARETSEQSLAEMPAPEVPMNSTPLREPAADDAIPATDPVAQTSPPVRQGT